MTAAIDAILDRIQLANISMLYLIVVLVTAVLFGRGAAVLAAIVAVLVFNYFFVEPTHTFIVSEPSEWLALLLFLLTAIVTGHLAAALRWHAREAEDRRRDAEARERDALVLYDVVRLVVETELPEALQVVAERLRRELDLAAVLIELGAGTDDVVSASAGDSGALRLCRAATRASRRVLGKGAVPSPETRAGLAHWVRIVPPRRIVRQRPPNEPALHVVPVQARDRHVGEIRLIRAPGARPFDAADDRLLSAVATQLGLALERTLLRRASIEAEIVRRADELKAAMINAASHDVRTPLASIIAAAGSLRQHDVTWTEAERAELAATIEAEARWLNRLFGNLLDLSRIASGSLQPDKAWHDVGAVLDGVLGRLRSVTARHGLRLDVPDDLPAVLLDHVEIDQVLSNLIENAARYAPAGTEITITARDAHGWLQLEVADRGPGLPAPTARRLFEPFDRGDGQRSPRSPGLGLGLAIARGFVEAHGGSIEAENRAGGGALFRVRLPGGTAVPPPIEVPA